jgi:hypothetical protein
MNRDTRTPAEARQLWIDAMRLEAQPSVIASFASAFAASFRATRPATKGTGEIRAFLALVASVAGLIWFGGSLT